MKCSSSSSECRKFSPNIFNRSKCQNCFKGKDAHSHEALESNRATRKVSCCGYLFVAPDWDFSLPANRNKRWQRRWFVLYDDGELAYSVDEHPETVPQAVIDMTCVSEVADAESVTGNPFALALTCPDKVHFVKGTSKEETKKWLEVLSKFPRSTVCGKYKRNATFPCIKIETPVPSSRRDTVDASSGYSERNGYGRGKLPPFHPDHDVFPTKDTSAPLRPAQDKKKQEIPSVSSENNCFRSVHTDPKSEDSKVLLKSLRKPHSRSDVSRMIPVESGSDSKSNADWKSDAKSSFHNPVYLAMSDVPSGKKLDSYENFFGREKPRCLRRQSSFGKKSDLQKWTEERTIHKSASVPNALLGDDNDHRPSLTQIRGDPDGCNLDSLPSYCASTAEFDKEQSNEGGSFLKKGWLVKQEGCRWNKYWFVLRNSGLAYYSDPIAEDGGIVDGVVDLRRTEGVQEVDSSSGHSFCITMKDLSKLYLSAVTAKIRSNWIRAILRAANLEEDSPEHTQSKPVEEEEEGEREVALPPSPPLARTAMSRVKERAKTRTHSRTRSPRPPAQDSDETDHSSSNNDTPVREKKATKDVPEKETTPRRRSSLKLESLEEGRRRAADVKDKLEDSSWAIWLEVSKFCKEVECKLDELVVGRRRGEVSSLVSSLVRVEEKLQRVSGELERAKLMLVKDSDIFAPSTHSPSYSSFAKQQQQEEAASRLGSSSSQSALLAHQVSRIREENRRLKADVKLAQCSSDDFELACIALRKAGEQARELHRSNMQLMVARVDDLTAKLFASEKSVRQLRQRVSKLEQRQERRRSSLKGKEGLSLSKEYEAKLHELEAKIGQVEGALGSYSLKPTEGPQDPPKEPPSLLMRLHNLDRKVKDVSETVATSLEETTRHEELPKPKICLQVNLNENAPLATTEDWNSLSLSASTTDLTAADETPFDDCPEDPLSASFDDCPEKLGREAKDFLPTSVDDGLQETHFDDFPDNSLSTSFADTLESLGRKVTSLVSWLKTSLQLLYARGHMLRSSRTNFAGGEESEELSRLVRTLEFVTAKVEETQPSGSVTKLLYNLILLQEVTNVVFKIGDFEKYKAAILAQHLTRVRETISGIERYVSEKSSPVQSSGQKISLCNIVACLLFHEGCSETRSGVGALFEEVDARRRNVSSILAEFKGKFIERFCTTILELSEDSVCDRAPKSPDQSPKPLGQKQFLSHISHIVAQVSQSFVTHVSKSLNDVCFLSSAIQYGERWSDFICRLLQQELSLLSSEIKSICVKHLENGFFSSSKCGVLVEYMHCSVSELAQIVAIVAVVDGTVVLVKDALYGEGRFRGNADLDGETTVDGRSVQLRERSSPPRISEETLESFHSSLLLRAKSLLSNLPPLRFPPGGFLGLCNPEEAGVAHRSVSSLLCFKRRWRGALESERRGHREREDALSDTIREMQRNCRSCFELRQEVSYLQGELDESRALARSGSLCDKCRGMRRLGEAARQKEQAEEAAREKEKQFAEEKEQLERDLRVAQGNIKRLEHHYDEELRRLHRLYEEKLRQKNENLREDIRTKYSEEIHQLKVLCERGVSAMDASHQKVVCELERRHQRELEQLRGERERALREEAHATALALEAVKRAHSEELLRQVQKLKEEFVLQNGERTETEAFKKCYESDLSSVKREILSTVEKCSRECLENATLRERLEVTNRQLETTTTQVVELLAKNEELKARLTCDTSHRQEDVII